MELRHVRYFIAVAEELNFTRAAARLGIGQPPLSQQIKDLEADLGVTLLRRLPHGAELTEAGRAFLADGRRVLTAFENAKTSAKRAARGESGRLRLGFTGSAHFNEAVPIAIRDFGRSYPDVGLQLEEANTYKLLEALDAGDIDVAFTHSGLEDRGRLHVHHVQVEPLLVALPQAHRCAARTSVDVAELADDNFVMKSRHVGPELHRAVFEVCRSAGFEPKLGQEAPQLATVISLVAAELGVSLVPSSMQHVKAVGVVYLPPENAHPHINLSLTWRRHERSKVVDNFVSLVKRSSVAEPQWPGSASRAG